MDSGFENQRSVESKGNAIAGEFGKSVSATEIVECFVNAEFGFHNLNRVLTHWIIRELLRLFTPEPLVNVIPVARPFRCLRPRESKVDYLR